MVLLLDFPLYVARDESLWKRTQYQLIDQLPGSYKLEALIYFIAIIHVFSLMMIQICHV